MSEKIKWGILGAATIAMKAFIEVILGKSALLSYKELKMIQHTRVLYKIVAQ